MSQSEGSPDRVTGMVPTWATATSWSYTRDRKTNAWVQRPPSTETSVNNRPLSVSEYAACQSAQPVEAPSRLGGVNRVATSSVIARHWVKLAGQTYKGVLRRRS